VRQHYPELQALGAEVLAVSFTKPSRVAAYVAAHPLPFPALADPERAAYAALGLGRTSWRKVLRGGVLARYLRLILRGWMPHRTAAGEDVMQLGGDFVLDRHGRLAYAYRSAEPTDRPPAADLLAAVRRAAAADTPGAPETSE
jgi:peroxiredoxin